MQKALIRINSDQLFYLTGPGGRRAGANPQMRGDCSGLYGNLDDCNLNTDERAAGVGLAELIG